MNQQPPGPPSDASDVDTLLAHQNVVAATVPDTAASSEWGAQCRLPRPSWQQLRWPPCQTTANDATTAANGATAAANNYSTAANDASTAANYAPPTANNTTAANYAPPTAN